MAEVRSSKYLQVGSYPDFPQPADPYPPMSANKSERVSEKEAGYMELSMAVKDSDCEKVKVDGGVSSELGCCNLYQPQATGTSSFKCGVCEYLVLK